MIAFDRKKIFHGNNFATKPCHFFLRADSKDMYKIRLKVVQMQKADVERFSPVMIKVRLGQIIF